MIFPMLVDLPNGTILEKTLNGVCTIFTNVKNSERTRYLSTIGENVTNGINSKRT